MDHQQKRLTKREKRLLREGTKQEVTLPKMVSFTPLTPGQGQAIEAWRDGQHLALYGTAGTGKTFLAMALGFSEVAAGEASRVVIVRTTAQTRDMGFIPGYPADKIREFEKPYRAHAAKLFGHDGAFDMLRSKGMLEFTTTTFLRGTEIDDAIIVCDEAQNYNFHELDTTITRIGRNSRIIVAGDTAQTDLLRDYDRSGLAKFLDILKSISSFEMVSFGPEDVLRSGLVREYILAKDRYLREKKEG